VGRPRSGFGDARQVAPATNDAWWARKLAEMVEGRGTASASRSSPRLGQRPRPAPLTRSFRTATWLHVRADARAARPGREGSCSLPTGTRQTGDEGASCGSAIALRRQRRPVDRPRAASTHGHWVLLSSSASCAPVEEPARSRAAEWLHADALPSWPPPRPLPHPCRLRTTSSSPTPATTRPTLVVSPARQGPMFGVPPWSSPRVNHPKNEWLFDAGWGVDVAVSTPLAADGPRR